jgi:hypothetical protein
MRTSDLFHLAVKTLKGRWAVLPAAGFAIAAFCLCFAGAILSSVQEEKAQPYEIVVSAQEDKVLTDSDVAELSKIEDVLAATAILEAPVIVGSGDSSAALTLTGMDSAFIKGDYEEGGAYPPDTVMPYIVLNEAARKAFSDGSSDASVTDAPKIDWLGASFWVQSGEGMKPVTAKVCGILAKDEEEEEPAAYISIKSAKALMKQSGSSTGYGSLRVRVTDIGHTDSVAKAIAVLGLMPLDSTKDLQTVWDMETMEMTYLLVLGGFCLICAATLAAVHRSALLWQDKKALEALFWLGMNNRDVSRLFTLHALVISVVGAAIGVLVSLALPSFLAAEMEENSVFLLSPPLISVLASLVICLAAGVVPTCVCMRRLPLTQRPVK